MQVEFVFFARSAEVNADGTLSILGAGIEGARAFAFPFILPSITVAAKFVLDKDEKTGLHHGRVLILDQSGVPIQEVSGVLTVLDKVPAVTRRPYINLVAAFNGLTFPNAGKYDFIISVDEIERARACLWVDDEPINVFQKPPDTSV